MQSIGYAARNSSAKLRPMPFERREPGAGDVALDVLFCGVCHSDLHQVRNDWGNTVYPCLPGHEIVGRITAVGSAVRKFGVGDLVGIGCMVDSCLQCTPCRAGTEQYREGPHGWTATYNGPQKPDGSNTFGGYSSNYVVREEFLIRIPAGLDPAHAAPLLCAGVTTWSPMRHWKVKAGDRVGVVGLGGLGHVAVKLARSLGAEVTVLTRDHDKFARASELGAAAIAEGDKQALAAAELSLDFILDTIPEKHDVNPFVKLLKHDGTIVLVGALEPNKPIDNSQLAFRRRSVGGSLIGGIAETQEVLDHCAAHGITADIEVIPIDQVNRAFSVLEKGDVAHRFVIDMASLAHPDAG